MGHEDSGHYAAKHKDKQLKQAVAEQLNKIAENGHISCSSAHRLSKSLNMQPLEIGIQIDLMELRLWKCQLGLFGHTDSEKKSNPNIEIPSIEISDELDKQLKASALSGRISCKDCWNIASRMKIRKLDVVSACEKKNIKIKPCQLGAF